MLSVIFDVAGINHTVFCFYRTKVVSDQFFLNDPIGRCVVRKIPARDQPGRFIVGEMFQSLAAVAAQMIDHVVENCAAMGQGMSEGGLRLVSGGTDNHLLLVDTYHSFNLTGKEAETLLDKVHIKLYDKINPRHSLNFQECINYAKLIFYYLLQHSDKKFSEKEIISVAESVYRNNSVRNAEEKVNEFRL